MIIGRRLVDEGHETRQCGVSLNEHHDNFGENHSEGQNYLKVDEREVTLLLTNHLLDAAEEYDVGMERVLNALLFPDEVVRGHSGRFVAHKLLNDYLIRVVYGYENNVPVVINYILQEREGTLKMVFMKIKYYPDSDILEIRVLDEKPKYGEEYNENIIIHYSEENRVVKIEILDASKAILRFLQPILEQKPIKGIVEAQ